MRRRIHIGQIFRPCLYAELLWTILLFCCASAALRAQEPVFYRGREYGSEANYNPLSLLLNGSYDIIQLDGNSRAVLRFRFAEHAAQLFRNLGNPFGRVSRFGWERFLRMEVLPLAWNKREALWWPNYQLHLVGGGMSFVAMREWYEYHAFPAPTAWSIATMAAYHLLNEVQEINVEETVDPIADLYIFDAAGIVLFSLEGVPEFFGGTLNMADWSLQPGFSFAPFELQNNGQYFSFKWRLPFDEHLHVFYITGLNGLVGASYVFPDRQALSFGAGLRAKRIAHLSNPGHAVAELAWSAGLFWDRENSLLASLVVSEYVENSATLNIYPGVFNLCGISPGIWASLTRSGALLGGINLRWAPGIAVR